MTRVQAGATAFITGGAQGIGLAIARALAQQGVKVALADIDAVALAKAGEELSSITEVEAHVLDVRDRRAFAEVADAVDQQLGPVSLLFNNAGIAGGTHVQRMSYDDWDWMLGVNLQGVVNGIQTFLPRMLQRGGGGYIVNTSSGAGLVPSDVGFLYATSKYAVVGLSESLHRELAPYGIGVSVLCPGRVATDIVLNTWKRAPRAADFNSPELQASLQASNKDLQSGTSPDRVAQLVLGAIEADRLHILTDDSLREHVLARTQLILEAIPGKSVDA